MKIFYEFIFFHKNLDIIPFMFPVRINRSKVIHRRNIASNANLSLGIGSPFAIHVERPPSIQITGECFHRLRLNDLGLFRIHCHGQRGAIQAKIISNLILFFLFFFFHFSVAQISPLLIDSISAKRSPFNYKIPTNNFFIFLLRFSCEH